MTLFRLPSVALVLVILLALLPTGTLAQDRADLPFCDFQQMEALQAALDSSREALLAKPGDPETEAGVEAAMAAYDDCMTTSLPPTAEGV